MENNTGLSILVQSILDPLNGHPETLLALQYVFSDSLAMNADNFNSVRQFRIRPNYGAEGILLKPLKFIVQNYEADEMQKGNEINHLPVSCTAVLNFYF
jgi:hypothetical protein